MTSITWKKGLSLIDLLLQLMKLICLFGYTTTSFECRCRVTIIPSYSFLPSFWQAQLVRETRLFSIPPTTFEIVGEVSANVTIKQRRECHRTSNKLLNRHPYKISLNQPLVSLLRLTTPFVLLVSFREFTSLFLASTTICPTLTKKLRRSLRSRWAFCLPSLSFPFVLFIQIQRNETNNY